MDLAEEILDGLMRRYKERVPDVDIVINGMVEAGMIQSSKDIENDHIAFRTMGVHHLGIQSLEKVFINAGYKREDFYNFEKKKLNAFWYSPPDNKKPRIFISELRVSELSDNTQAIIKKYTSQVKGDPVLELDLNDGAQVDEFLHKPLWSTPTWEEYQALQEESEYAAWVIYNRYYLNHFTVSVHNLPEPYNNIENYNEFLKNLGVILNNAGGEIKTSPDNLLRQSSTVAGLVEAEFPLEAGGTTTKKISGSYVEFAERSVLDEFKNLDPKDIKREHRRDGFEAGNADKIFESTFSSQTKR